MNAALLVNLIGFSLGIALYGLLAVMVVRDRSPNSARPNLLLLTTAILGILWNAGELYSFVLKDIGHTSVSPLVAALSYSALGFLPSVVVHSARAGRSRRDLLTVAAYLLSTGAAALHLFAAVSGASVPSDLALQAQTYGAIGLALGLLVLNLRQTLVEQKAIWASALLIFAGSAFHLRGQSESASFYVELLVHQSSLPLAFAILFKNYRFAFADLFLKRAFSLVLITAVAFGLYVLAAAPLMRYHSQHGSDDMIAAASIVGLWIATALVYPSAYRLSVWLVDRIVLKRSDYAALEIRFAERIARSDTTESVLDLLRSTLSHALTAGLAEWRESEDAPSAVRTTAEGALVPISVSEPPAYVLELADLDGGRQLLSDEIAMLESVALTAARRIDNLRVWNERREREVGEQQLAKLAAEAQLTALRAQIQPHFLFNALTTIGYLIKSSPEKAYDTLLRLTGIFRSVLKTSGEFSTLGDELDLVVNYLEIEKARLEERLSVQVDVPDRMRSQRIPALVLQPLVENSIKHGISENVAGGTIEISAAIQHDNGRPRLRLAVWDSGPGANARTMDSSIGLGLRNIRERLIGRYGGDASVDLIPERGGMKAVVVLPADSDTE